MKVSGLVLACLTLVWARDARHGHKHVYKSEMKVDVVKLRCDQSPFHACMERGSSGVVASSLNKFMLIKLLNEYCIPNAYVFGYDDHYGLFVLHSNGAIAPYDQFTNVSSYVLVVGECPCPVYKKEEPHYKEEVHHPQQPCYKEEVHHPQHPCYKEEHVNPRPRPCPPSEVYEKDEKCREVCYRPLPERPCRESSSSCDSSSSSEECRLYPGRFRKSCSSRNRCHRRCPTKIVEELTKLKKFTFDFDRYRRRGDVVVRVCSKEAKNKFERFIINRRGEIYNGRNKRCMPDCLPKCLRHPIQLLKLKKHIERKCCKEVCLYINEKCGIFVLIDGEFFCVSRKGRKPHLKRIRGERLRRLIKCGLYSVEFESIRCN